MKVRKENINYKSNNRHDVKFSVLTFTYFKNLKNFCKVKLKLVFLFIIVIII